MPRCPSATNSFAQVYPEAQGQRCWNHRLVNVLDRVPKRLQGAAKEILTKIPYAETRTEAGRGKMSFQRWCRLNQCEEAGALLDRDWDRLMTFYTCPNEHWRHLRTSNPIESPFAALRLRTDAAKRFKRVPNATAMIWKMLLLAEKSFRRLNAPELLREVYLEATYVDGVSRRNRRGRGRLLPDPFCTPLDRASFSNHVRHIRFALDTPFCIYDDVTFEPSSRSRNERSADLDQRQVDARSAVRRVRDTLLHGHSGSRVGLLRVH